MNRQRGGALLAVLWLSAALSAVAFTVAHTVRGETERAATAADGLRSYYLATGGIERATVWMMWASYRTTDNQPRFWERGMPTLRFNFPTGEAVVEMIPESSKLRISSASEEDLARLMMQIGVDSGRAAGIAAAIVDWRTPSPVPTDLDAYYLGLPSSFRPAHTSFQEIEELLLIRGMTPEIFYGWTERTPEGKLVTHTGLRDCVSIFGSSGAGGLDINTAQPGVMIAAGIPSDIVARIVRQRAVRPYKKEDLPALLQEHPSTSRLIVGGRTVYTLRSTARLKLANGQLSDLRRTVEAQVGRGEMSVNGKSWQILRWYDNAPRLQ